MSRAGSKWAADFPFSIVQAMTGCSTDGIRLFILSELLIKDSLIPVWTTLSVLASWAGAMSFTPRLAITCRQTTFWNTTIWNKSSGFVGFWGFFSSFKCHFFFKLFFVSYIQQRWQCCILLSRRFCLTHSTCLSNWGFPRDVHNQRTPESPWNCTQWWPPILSNRNLFPIPRMSQSGKTS